MRKKWVKRTVNIPKINSITSIADAWKYAAMVRLRQRELCILVPPPQSLEQYSSLHSEDHSVTDYLQVNLHTDDEIRAFELRHMDTPVRNIKQKITQLTSTRKKTTEWTGSAYAEEYDNKPAVNKLKPEPNVHIKLPSNVGQISRLSISCLYNAIICLVLSDMSEHYFLEAPEDIKKEFAYAIYTVFSLFAVDLRHTVLPATLLKIFSDVENYGYHAASRMHSILFYRCKNIYNKAIIEQAEKPVLRCPQCGSNEFVKECRGFTTKHLRNIHSKITNKAQDVVKYWPLFNKIMNEIAQDIRNNPGLKQILLERFQHYDLQARKDLLAKREYYSIEHYDPSKKWKKRSCNIRPDKLSDVGINNDIYRSEYKPLIKQAPDATYAEYLTGLLRKSGWPESLIKDKIMADINRAMLIKLAGVKTKC